ncbi:MAG: hypothetical protein QOH48_963 [Actinomycetota bacterium]|jgi:hypothetical protein|nr:hypothetical protein [Actinomycetota bacterium]
MKRMLIALPVVVLLGVLVPSASAGTSRQLVNFRTTVRACSGERVRLSGQVLLIDNFFRGQDGRIHDNFTLVPRQVTGTSATGVTYHAVGGLRETFHRIRGGSLTDTFTTQFIVVSENGDGNLLIVETLHITISANGDLTAAFDHFQARCVG